MIATYDIEYTFPVLLTKVRETAIEMGIDINRFLKHRKIRVNAVSLGLIDGGSFKTCFRKSLGFSKSHGAS